MKLNVYTVFDSKVGAYLQPFFMRGDGEAIRAMQETASNVQSNFHKYAADYTLFRIGEYEDQTDKIICLDHFENLGNVLSLTNMEV